MTQIQNFPLMPYKGTLYTIRNLAMKYPCHFELEERDLTTQSVNKVCISPKNCAVITETCICELNVGQGTMKRPLFG